jgi:hypothetical protein
MIVVCEGKTEAELLKGLRGRWRIASASIEIEGQRGVPSSVVQYAEKLRGAHSKGQRGEKVEVWAVFDRDSHPCWADAIRRAAEIGVHLASSNPCFELWAVLLHEDQRAYLERWDAQRRLQALHPKYHHEKNAFIDLEVAVARLDEATRRAAEIRRRAEADGEPWKNPVTRFDALVERLREIARVRG